MALNSGRFRAISVGLLDAAEYFLHPFLVLAHAALIPDMPGTVGCASVRIDHTAFGDGSGPSHTADVGECGLPRFVTYFRVATSCTHGIPPL